MITKKLQEAFKKISGRRWTLVKEVNRYELFMRVGTRNMFRLSARTLLGLAKKIIKYADTLKKKK